MTRPSGGGATWGWATADSGSAAQNVHYEDNDSPPSTGTFTPVMNRDAGEHKKYAASARSVGTAARPIGTLATASSNASGFRAVSGVSVMPGATALTRMPSGASSMAATRTAWFTAAFVAEYTRRPGRAPWARIDETTRMAVSGVGRSRISCAASWHPYIVPVKLRETMSS